MTSNHVLAVIVAVLIITTLPPPSSASGTCKTVAGISNTCKSAAESHRSIDYDFCVSSLHSAGRNADSADLPGLAAAAVHLAVVNSGSAESKIDDLMDLELDPAAKEKYNDCLDLYEDANNKLKDALDAINVKANAKAVRLLRSVPDAYGKCVEIFKGVSGVKSPVIDIDGEYKKLTEIGLAVISMVD